MNFKHRRKNRAVSEILSVVLMIMIVVSASILVLAFATTGLGSLASGFSNLLTGEGNSISQQLAIEQITYQYTSGLGPFVPITISNSQTSATAAPFQELITINPSLYTSLESTDLGNIRFYSSDSGGVFSGELDSWLESYSGSTTPYNATSATFWIEIPSGIPSLGSFTTYMSFQTVGSEFDGAFAGEAPNLSPIYAQYDNGANVFLAYFNGNTPTSSFSEYSGYALTQSIGIPYSSGTINALDFSGYKANNPALVFNVPLPNEPMIAESNVQDPNAYNPGTDTGHVGFLDNALASSVANAIGTQAGYSKSYFNLDYLSGGTYTSDISKQGVEVNTWTYSSVEYEGSSATSFSGYSAPQLYSILGGYQGTANSNPISGATNLYLGVLAHTSSTRKVNVFFNWMRARAAPPSDVMPGETPGQLTTAPQAGANLFVRNIGSTPVTLSEVYVQNVTSDTFVESFQINPLETLQPGALALIDVGFTPSRGETYSFSVATSLGYSIVASAPA